MSPGLRAEPTRVAVVVDAPDRGGGWQAMLTAALSRAGVAVVERENLAAILSERETTSTPPRLANVDVFLHFRRLDPTRWLIESVEASSGRLLGAVAAAAPTPDAVETLASAAAGLLAKAPSAPQIALRVAVVETGPRDARVFLLAARLREALAATGASVLDRALTQGLVEEKSDSERGWRDNPPDGTFFGADVFVELSARDHLCSVQVFQAREGKLLQSRDVPWDDPATIDAIVQGMFLAARQPHPPAPYLPTVETEALEPFYRGLALYDTGRFAEATAEFSRAFLLNDKFRDALLWEARCYDALGLPQLAGAVRRYAEIGLVGNGASASTHTAPVEAIVFLGVVGGPAALSAAAASALTRTGHEIRLPDHLARLRREYDWLAGLSETEGTRWDNAPSLFCRLALSGVAKSHGNTLTMGWTLTDTALGKTLGRRTLSLPVDPKSWPDKIADFLPDLLEAAESPGHPPSPLDESPKALEQAVRTRRGLEANVALLKLVLTDPANPLLRAKGFERGESKRDGLDAMVNFALRDALLARLPADSPQRPWLELTRLYAFLETEPTGRRATGERPDVVAELERFVAANTSSPAAAVARYSILYERQDEMPPAELARACDTLLDALRGFPESDWLAQMTRSLRDLARVADGQTSVGLPDTGKKNLPCRIRIKWTSDGSPTIERFSDWSATAYAWVSLSPAEKITEARAALAINGRVGDRRKIQDRWLEEFPHSMTMAAFVVNALHELNFWHGKPIVHPLDWTAERAAFLRAIDYAAETLAFWLGRAETAPRADRLENTVWEFFMALNERVYLGVLSDEKYLALRDRLRRRMDETNARLGRAGWAWRQPRFLAWQDVTPAQARELRKDRLNDIGPEIYDRAVLTAGIEAAAQAAWKTGSFDPQPLWTRLRGWDINDAFTAPELAAFAQRLTPEILRRHRATPPNVREMGFLIEIAIALLNGGARPEAEEIFRMVLNGPPEAAAMRANAAFRLAQIFRIDGRKPEAIAMARLGLEISGPTSWALIGKHYDAGMQRDIRERGIAGGLSAHLTRLLGELRFDPASAQLPPGVGVVRIPTPNLDNPVVNVFYRVPPGSTDTPRRVLVVVPSLNHDVLDLLQPGAPWTRFADEHGFVLVAPRFYASDRAERAEHAFTYFQNAQVWSGKALLAALDHIAERTPIQTDRLRFHGYGAGAGFAARFARWRPDRVAAVSLHGGGMSLPWFHEYPGLLPLTASKDVRFLITAGENDDFAENTQNRFACAEAFATVLRGAGASVEWKPIPGVGHFPTPEMEAASRNFLSQP